VFGFDAISHLDGSEIIGKTSGSIYVTDVKDFAFPATYDLANGLIPTTYIYTSLLWKQVDRDNNDDILTCRLQLEGGKIARHSKIK